MAGKMRMMILLLISLLSPAAALAESRHFLGTRTGWARTTEVFYDGRYNGRNLFLVIGTGPTTSALKTISGWKSRTTYGEDIRKGFYTFSDQAGHAVDSIPENAKKIGKSFIDLFSDPVEEILDFSIITPAAVIYKTATNAVLIGWHGMMTAAEPVARLGAGTVAMVGSPFIKPVTYTGVGLLYAGTALYGYGSSAAVGTVLAGATGAVAALDLATAPVVAMAGTEDKPAPSLQEDGIAAGDSVTAGDPSVDGDLLEPEREAEEDESNAGG